MANPLDLNEFNETEVLANAVEGDADSFSVLYMRYVGRIYNYIYYRTGSSLDAEDLTERVFYRAMGHIRTYKDKGVPFSAWLYRIAHNLVANWHRDSQRRREVPLEEDDQLIHFREMLPESTLIHDQDNEILISAINKLPSDRQQLIILKFVENLSNAEIATIMGKSEGAIKSYYHRTLIALRKEMEKLPE